MHGDGADAQSAPDGRWEAARACPNRVPVLSLGRRVLLLASEGTGTLAGTFFVECARVAAGGPQLRDLSLSSELLKASSMQAVVDIKQASTSGASSIYPPWYLLPYYTGGRQGPDGHAC